MTFFNTLFIFLFSVVPIYLNAGAPPVQGSRSTEHSRNSSPVVSVRVPVICSEMYYEWPGCREITYVPSTEYIYLTTEELNDRLMRHARKSLPVPGTSALQAPKAASLPCESKLEKMPISTAAALSQSTEKLQQIEKLLETANESTLHKLKDLIAEKLTGVPSHPIQ